MILAVQIPIIDGDGLGSLKEPCKGAISSSKIIRGLGELEIDRPAQAYLSKLTVKGSVVSQISHLYL
jgi:hypothetical protein